MLSTGFTLVALILYLCSSGYLLSLLLKKDSLKKTPLYLLLIFAVISHSLGLYGTMVTHHGIDLAINKVFALVMLSVNIIVLLSSLRKSLHNLFILLTPVSAIAMALMLINLGHHAPNHFDMGLSLHILLSIVSYSLLLLAVFQALLLYWQNSHLKKRPLSGLIRHLPPLQTMEALMFEFVWVGVILLASGILVGAWYIEDMFAQSLAHKTVLSMIALGVFAMLLVGRSLWGWRGNQAIHWVLVGFCTLMLAYFGSKLVLEVILV